MVNNPGRCCLRIMSELATNRPEPARPGRIRAGIVHCLYASTSGSRAFDFVPSGAPNRCFRLLESVSNALRRLQLLLDSLQIVFV
jgi:hypothetical protein